MIWRKAVFIVLIVFCLSPLGSPLAALILGIGLALTIKTPFLQLSGRPNRLLFEASVVLLGFGTDLKTVYQAVKGGLLYVVAGTLALLAIGYVVGRVSRLNGRWGILGGEEFRVDGDDVSDFGPVVAVLSILALVVFPFISNYLRMTPDQAGVWSAMAVPGVASAIGVSQTISIGALSVAVPLVLARLLLMAAAALAVYRKQAGGGRTAIPWFILLFVGVTAFRTYAPVFILPSVFDSFVNLANAGIVLSLFLLGASLPRDALKDAGLKTGAAIMLWIAFSALSLAVVLRLL